MPDPNFAQLHKLSCRATCGSLQTPAPNGNPGVKPGRTTCGALRKNRGRPGAVPRGECQKTFDPGTPLIQMYLPNRNQQKKHCENWLILRQATQCRGFLHVASKPSAQCGNSADLPISQEASTLARPSFLQRPTCWTMGCFQTKLPDGGQKVNGQAPASLELKAL